MKLAPMAEEEFKESIINMSDDTQDLAEINGAINRFVGFATTSIES